MLLWSICCPCLVAWNACVLLMLWQMRCRFERTAPPPQSDQKSLGVPSFFASLQSHLETQDQKYNRNTNVHFKVDWGAAEKVSAPCLALVQMIYNTRGRSYWLHKSHNMCAMCRRKKTTQFKQLMGLSGC